GIPTFLMPVYHGTTAGRMIACREYFSPAGYRSLLKEFKIALRANAAVCVSPLAEQEARRYYFLRCPTVVIENAADVEIFRPLKAISEEPRILFIGRSGDRVKNTDRILEAVSQVAKKGTRIILSAVPGISNTNSNNIESLGPKNSFDLYKLFQSSRALILGSLYEGDPIVLHEAKSAGLPILASDLPQMRYALLNYKNSYFFNPRNTDAIANQIESLLADPNLKPCSLASSWSNSAKKLLNFYSQQIAAQRS
ncbi:MAG TPA: glycosyltransferase, partial [Oligoflexia bacterium]|nr:glycosyltransferase [Oligoflexia bacterium]